ncbi:MAG: signal peptidase II [Acidobacteria bacterium]|nr:MAG: signal peptidase II [Acidobacteriota bacterium]
MMPIMSEALAARVTKISRLIHIAIALLVFAGDQATKSIVESSIPEREVVPVIPGLFNITHVKNEGAAFGLFADSPAPWKTALLIVVSAALLATVVSVVWRTRRLHWEAGVGLSLVLGGALSNLVDRIRMGRVVDFLDFYFKNYHWYTFNLADAAIVAGAGFLILHVLFAE